MAPTLSITSFRRARNAAVNHRSSVGGRGRAGLPVAPRVVAQHAIAALERANLLVPHREVAGQRVAEGHHRALALDLVVDVDAVGVELHVALTLPSPRWERVSGVHSWVAVRGQI